MSREELLNDIPTKTIRVFRKSEENPVEIKGNTQITLFNQIMQSEGPTVQNHFPQYLYAYFTKDGSVAIATPNYAGNVISDLEDVMQEYRLD